MSSCVDNGRWWRW